MAGEQRPGRGRSRPQTQPAAQTEEPELALPATPLKASKPLASGSRSPVTVAQLASPEAGCKGSGPWAQACEEPLPYEPHRPVPLEPASREALAFVSQHMVPLDLQRRSSSSIARELSVSRETDEEAKVDVHSEAEAQVEISEGPSPNEDDEDDKGSFDVQLAADEEHDVVTNDRAVATAVKDECIDIFLREVPRLTWNKFRHHFRRGHQYAGFIIYGVWRDGRFRVDYDSTKFPPGSVVIRRTDTEQLRKVVTYESGLVHPQVFKDVFKLDRYPLDLVAEAFALGPPGSFERDLPDSAVGRDSGAGELLCEGVEIRFNSSFNSSQASWGTRPGRDESRQMSPRTKELLKDFLLNSKWLQGFGGLDPEAESGARRARTASRPAEQKQKKATRCRWVEKKQSATSDNAAAAAAAGSAEAAAGAAEAKPKKSRSAPQKKKQSKADDEETKTAES